MKKIIISSTIVISLLISCNTKTDNLDQLIQNGNFSEAIKIIDLELQNKSQLSMNEIEVLQKKLYNVQAVKHEYTLSYNDVYKKLKKQISDLTAQDMRDWKNDYSLEYYLIDGEIKYYYNCIFDLLRVNKEAAKRAGITDNKESDRTKYPLETINAFGKDSVFSKEINIAFSFFQNLDEIPEQDVLRAWIPYVRENKFQSDIQIIDKNVENIIRPKNDNLTSMIYFEHKVTKNYNSKSDWKKFFTNPKKAWIKSIKKPSFINDSTLLLQFIYKYKSKAYYNKIVPEDVKPYNVTDLNYQKYTKETVYNQFTEYLRDLSKEIIGEENNDYLKARLIYEWICKNIVWTSPKAVMGDYAEYTAKYRRGDCSAKSNLFISLCRINKIPAREQGGWVVRPNRGHAQHSWAQVYFKPYGWLPVDVTFGSHLINQQDKRIKYFYFGNCTPYHMIIYDDNPKIVPPKEYPCVFGGGAQLGVFQWKGGDLEPNVKIDSYVE